MHTYFRTKTHEMLRTITLTGSVIDLGGTLRAEYADSFKGSFERTAVNIKSTTAHVVADLEQPLSFPDASYEGALLINTIEHIYNTQGLLKETSRILKTNGKIIIVVPYLMAIHPSPNDYYRFSKQALEQLTASAGFTNIQVSPIGSGVFIARHSLLSRLLPHTLQLITEYPMRALALTLDKLWNKLAQILRKKYTPEDYPLGYLLVAQKK